GARELVRRLDGSPLAIELAAARVNVLPPAKLLERFDHHLDLLASTRADVAPRHRTLRAAIEGSWDSLTDVERRALAACSIFRGGFTLDAAESVVAIADSPPVVDVLEALVGKSVVQRVETSASERRFRLAESVRDFAAERLAMSGEADAARARHGAY